MPFSMPETGTQDGLFTSHNDHFRNDPEFQAAYRRGVKASHGIDPELSGGFTLRYGQRLPRFTFPDRSSSAASTQDS